MLIGATLGILIGAGTINGLMFVVSLYFQNADALGVLSARGRPRHAAGDDRPGRVGAARAEDGAARSARATVVALGFAITAIGFGVLAFTKSSWGYAAFVIPFVVAAVGMSMTNGPCSSVSTSAVPEEQVGAASGISNMARYVGAAVFTAVAAAVYGGTTTSKVDSGKPNERRARRPVSGGSRW